MIQEESAILSDSVEYRLDELLKRNKRNRMAFENKMMFYLLNLQLEKSVRELDHLEDFGYPNIPRHYQEAILIYESISGRTIDLHGRQISPQTRRAYSEFFARLAEMYDLGYSQGAAEALGERFGDTYFVYYFFGE